MKTIQEAARTVPVMAETEVLVVGSGPGGLAAALASARQGAETMLMERFGCFGGNITQACVETIAWYRHPQTIEAGGIGMEFEGCAVEMKAATPEVQSISHALNTEFFKYIADRLVIESAVRPLLHCYFVEPVMDGAKIAGVITESKSGRQAILAKRVIDATGDADIAARAGAPCTQAPLSDRMGVTVSFACSGVNKKRFMEYVDANPGSYKQWATESTGKEDNMFSPYIAEPFQKAKEAGAIPADIEIAGTWSSISDEGEATYLNVVYIPGNDCTDVWDLTRGEMEGRQQAIWAIEALNKYLPGFEKARLRNFCASLGTRESRKIIGRGSLSGRQTRSQARFDDAIGIFPEFLDAYGIVILPTTGRYFQVPFGIILPQRVENLLVVGRAVAGDQQSHAATRQMMCCAVTGQGAGIAAALSLHEGVSVAEVDIKKLQSKIQKQGVRID
ncbi:FAD-dependent oxidoreductase [Thermodesulfobacteriota bacterium]